MAVNFLTVFALLLSVFTLLPIATAVSSTDQAKCDFDKQVLRRSKQSGEKICCYFTWCEQNEQYKFCEYPNTNDSCLPCEKGFVNHYRMNTRIKDERVEEDMCKNVTVLCNKTPPPGARIVNNDCYKTGVLIFECDRARQFTGINPENCMPATVQCPEVGMELSFEDTCIPCKSGYSKTQYGLHLCSKDKEEDNQKPSVNTDEHNAWISTQKSIILTALNSSTAGNTPTKPPLNTKSESDSGVTSVGLGVGIPVVIVTIGIIFMIYKCCRRNKSKAPDNAEADPFHDGNGEQPEMGDGAQPVQPEEVYVACASPGLPLVDEEFEIRKTKPVQHESNLQRAASCHPPLDYSGIIAAGRHEDGSLFLDSAHKQEDDSLRMDSAPTLDPLSISSNEGSSIPNRYQSTGDEASSGSSFGLKSAASLHMSSLNSGSSTSQEASGSSTNPSTGKKPENSSKRATHSSYTGTACMRTPNLKSPPYSSETGQIAALKPYTGSNIPVQKVLPLRKSQDEVTFQERHPLREQTNLKAVIGAEKESSEVDLLLQEEEVGRYSEDPLLMRPEEEEEDSSIE